MAKVVILSGAGLSAESGISTFRDSGGLWDQYDVSVVCNYDSLDKNEALTLEFYDKRRAELATKEPNKAHREYAKLKKRHPHEIAIITQNVDDLFEKAGLTKEEVIHLHGFLPEVRCRNGACAAIFDIGYKSIYDFHNGFCPKCGEKLRPNIIFFGEMAPMYERLNQEIQDCEFIVVVGTSGNVIGVNTMANFIEHSILNNLEESSAIEHQLFDKTLFKPATKAVDEIVEDIESFLA
ncbi:NAD-dependent protein deacetylase of SIR2 family [hydrothermal vent metagenome]|uniref:NAD-dependent protein deacetylase of SIR2 family n=1 Tax=hydrothermal vent metagenome TaxID=652676 RepID=A0A1W1C6Q1_9ZZZZ